MYPDKILYKFDSQLIRFILVGGMNTLVSYLLFLLLIKSGMHYVFAMLIVWCAGVLLNFKTLGKWVFGNKDKSLIVKFVTLYGAIYLISLALLWVFNGVFNNISLSGAVTVVITSGLSFLGNKKIVFVTCQNNLNQT